MASLTIRNIDEDVKRKLRLRAAKHGRSMEEELRQALRALVEEKPFGTRSEAEAKATFDRLTALGRPPLEPFDLKAFSDELSEGSG